MRKIELMYKLKRKAINIDDVIPYLFLATPIITALLVMFLWSVLGAGAKN